MADKDANQEKRAQRLARQLRENLKRRKAQARSRKQNQAPDIEKRQ
jgi:hypothetical protein